VKNARIRVRWPGGQCYDLSKNRAKILAIFYLKYKLCNIIITLLFSKIADFFGGKFGQSCRKKAITTLTPHRDRSEHLLIFLRHSLLPLPLLALLLLLPPPLLLLLPLLLDEALPPPFQLRLRQWIKSRLQVYIFTIFYDIYHRNFYDIYTTRHMSYAMTKNRNDPTFCAQCVVRRKTQN
jgi:hypothetical protein